jgi:hypothetical protein
MITLGQLVFGGLQQIQTDRAWEPIGPSGHSTCYRQDAYRYHHVPRTDTVSTAAADRGTLIHDGVTHRIRTAPGYDPQQLDADVRITIPGLPRPGSADVVDYRNRICWDIKTVNSRSYDWMLDRGLRDGYFDQINLYITGLTVEHPGDWRAGVLLIDLDSTTGETLRHHEEIRPHDPLRSAELIRKIATRHTALTASASIVASAADSRLMAETFPREGSGPTKFPCSHCRWVSTCWPEPTGDRTPQAETVKDDPGGIAEHAEAYVSARAEESKWKAAKEDAAAFLRGNIGTYRAGDVDYRVALTGGADRPPVPDVDAMAAVLGGLGLEVPTKPQSPTPKRLDVKRVPHQP